VTSLDSRLGRLCQAWARAKAFGREPTCDFAEACAEAYEASMEMQRRGTSILIGL
jgi:hypothetical protein